MRELRSMGRLLCAGLLGCGAAPEAQSVLPGVESLVLAKRAYATDGESEDVSGGAGRVVDYLRYVPGGGVFVLTPAKPDGETRELTSDYEGVDIAGLDLSFDGREVVFSMRHADDDGHAGSVLHLLACLRRCPYISSSTNSTHLNSRSWTFLSRRR